MTCLAAGLLESCEKVICDQLKVLNQYEKLCEDALKSIRKLHEASREVWSLQSPNILLLKQILSEVIKGSESVSLTTTDSLAVGHKSLIKDTKCPQEIGTMLSDLENKNLDTVTESSQEISIDENKLSDLEKFLHQMECISGPKIGVRYQIEVTSPLAPDGSFWVRNKENEFLLNKLEPLSNFLRKTTIEDTSLWKVKDFSKVLCVKSLDTQLWMRALVERRKSPSEVRVRYIDYGTTEDCQENRLCSVPEVLARIPHMAFHCSFFEKAVNLGYDAKWKFSDLTNKQILHFTCEKRVFRDDKIFSLGKLETASFDNVPSVNISALMTDFYADNDELVAIKNPAIQSRDIRTQNPNSNITVVTEFITKKEDNICENNINQDVTQSLLVNPDSKNKKCVSPILIPNTELINETSCKIVNWGDCDTPCADDFEVAFEPLDEKIFEDESKIKSPVNIEIDHNIIHYDSTKTNNEDPIALSEGQNSASLNVSDPPLTFDCMTYKSNQNEIPVDIDNQNSEIPVDLDNLNSEIPVDLDNLNSEIPVDLENLNSDLVISDLPENINIKPYQVTDLNNVSKDIIKIDLSTNKEKKTVDIEEKTTLNDNTNKNKTLLSNKVQVVTNRLDANNLNPKSNLKLKIGPKKESNLKPSDNFEIKSFQEYLMESHAEWVARELCNLTHRYLESSSSIFFLKMYSSLNNEVYKELEAIYKNQCLYLKDYEADAVKYNQTRNVPMFFILKKKFNPDTENDSLSLGICQVLGPVKSTFGKWRFKCSAQFISTATIEWKWVTNRKNYEIEKPNMRSYLKSLLFSLQFGKCCDTFKKLTQLQNKVEKSPEINNANNIDPDEDWDLDINPHVVSQSQNLGSDDECERDINADYETFGVSQKDIILLNPI